MNKTRTGKKTRRTRQTGRAKRLKPAKRPRTQPMRRDRVYYQGRDVLWLASRIPDEKGRLQARFRMVGNSLVLTIPVAVRVALELEEGDLAEMVVARGRLVVIRLARAEEGGIDGDLEADVDLNRESEMEAGVKYGMKTDVQADRGPGPGPDQEDFTEANEFEEFEEVE